MRRPRAAVAIAREDGAKNPGHSRHGETTWIGLSAVLRALLALQGMSMSDDDLFQLPSTTVSVHAGAYLAHDLLSAMPLVCTGKCAGIRGEYLWERIARALQHVQPEGPYPCADAITIFVRSGALLAMRCDVELTELGIVATIVGGGLPKWRHAPIPVDTGDDVLTIARKVFAAGLPCLKVKSRQIAGSVLSH